MDTNYSTKKAIWLSDWSKGQYGQYNFLQEILYRSECGEFFIEVIAGLQAESPYSEGGEDGIIPICPRTAAEWCNDRLDADDAQKIINKYNLND